MANGALLLLLGCVWSAQAGPLQSIAQVDMLVRRMLRACAPPSEWVPGQPMAACTDRDKYNLAVLLADQNALREAEAQLGSIRLSELSEEMQLATEGKRAELLLAQGRPAEAKPILDRLLRQPLGLRVRDALLWTSLLCDRALGQPVAASVSPAGSGGQYSGWAGDELLEADSLFSGDALEGFVSRRQPLLLPGAAAMLGWDPAQRVLSNASELAAEAGDEPVVAEAVRREGGVSGLADENHRRLLCRLDWVLADLDPRLPRAGCLERRGLDASQWGLYLNLQPDLFDQPKPPYTRPVHRLKRLLPLPRLGGPVKVARGALQAAELWQMVSLWLGGGKTAGALHSDSVDNLYVLLAGAKRFRVFPPSEAVGAMLTSRVRHVSPAGRISYDWTGQQGKPAEWEGSSEFQNAVRRPPGQRQPGDRCSRG